MNPYEPGWLAAIKKKHPFPGGWRKHARSTKAEDAAIKALLEKQRRALERDKPLAMVFDGKEYARRRYLHTLAGELDKTAWNNIRADTIGAFLYDHSEIQRRRIRWGVYYNVTQFAKAWQKRLRTSRRTEKLRAKS